MPFRLGDKELERSVALPNGAATTNLGTPWDLGFNSTGEFHGHAEIKLSVPAVTVTELPNGETIKYEFQSADNEAFSVNVQSEGILITQTGAGGAGAAAATKRFRPATDCPRFLRYRAIKTGTGNPSAKTADAQYLF